MPVSNRKLESISNLQCAIIRFVRTRDQAVRAEGLEPLQYQLLMLLQPFRTHERQPNISDMATQLSMQHHSAVELVSRLEERGLLRRARAKHDRRHVHLYLTTQGRKVVKDRLAKEYENLHEFAQGVLPDLKALINGNGKRV